MNGGEAATGGPVITLADSLPTVNAPNCTRGNAGGITGAWQKHSSPQSLPSGSSHGSSEASAVRPLVSPATEGASDGADAVGAEERRSVNASVWQTAEQNTSASITRDTKSTISFDGTLRTRIDLESDMRNEFSGSQHFVACRAPMSRSGGSTLGLG